ncbi:MAG: hypothetical protein SAK29_32565 [Scytonema sp. PMC 1069.18]|nr:hypothetical protein [Scytonema sp. PMC 1069.18]MEC4885614.1 hypothetical protein [Scytonema sp. PMC 1070.18]
MNRFSQTKADGIALKSSTVQRYLVLALAVIESYGKCDRSSTQHYGDRSTYPSSDRSSS